MDHFYVSSFNELSLTIDHLIAMQISSIASGAFGEVSSDLERAIQVCTCGIQTEILVTRNWEASDILEQYRRHFVVLFFVLQ